MMIVENSNGYEAIVTENDLIDVFVAILPEPDAARITAIAERERLANPHGDSYKPHRRAWDEIKNDLRYENAAELLLARRRFMKRGGLTAYAKEHNV